MATQNIRKFNTYGYCRYEDKCRNIHVNEYCENSACDTICKYYRDYNYCKFGEFCKFVHIIRGNFFQI